MEKQQMYNQSIERAFYNSFNKTFPSEFSQNTEIDKILKDIDDRMNFWNSKKTSLTIASEIEPKIKEEIEIFILKLCNINIFKYLDHIVDMGLEEEYSTMFP